MEHTDAVRALTSGLRRLLFVAAGLVALAAFQLFALTDHTDKYFSWTIEPGLTAAFLGAGYAASFFFEFLAARRAQWVDARLTVLPVLSFTLLTEIATLLHLDRFHFGEPLIWAGAAAWVWVAIYSGVPVAMIALLPKQLLIRGADPPRSAPIRPLGVAILGVQAAVMLPVGLLLFIAPDRWASIWPWALTPLTGQAIGAWLIGIGIGLIAVIGERDLLRVRPGLVAYTILSALELVALGRYARDVDWGVPQAWIYLAVVASMLAAGLVGLLVGVKTANSQPTEAPPP